MTTIIATQLACSAAFLAVAFLGVRPLALTPVIIPVIAACWWMA